MQKKLVLSLAAIMVATSAHAGLLDMLGLKKSAEPTTLAEACDKDEITKVCPEILLGEKTIPSCLVDNVKSLSKKCAKYVKNAVKNQVDQAKGTVDSVKTEAVQVANEQAAEIAEQKAAAQATVSDIKAAAKQVEQDAKDTGAAFKGIFKSSAK